MRAILFLVTIIYSAISVCAKSGLPIPRFASLKSDKIYVRAGPNINYPIKWVFLSSTEPVEIVAEFEQWRRIRDKYGDDGWVHQSMISGKRYIVVIGNSPQEMYSDMSGTKVVAKLMPELRCLLKKANDKWCYIDCRGSKGWVMKEQIWGVYLKEFFK